MKKQIANETSELIKLRDWLIPMLMNGQATISD
jgi:type I restriction enzyme S subunit